MKYILIIIVLTLLVGCSNENLTNNERLFDNISEWSYNLSAMEILPFNASYTIDCSAPEGIVFNIAVINNKTNTNVFTFIELCRLLNNNLN